MSLDVALSQVCPGVIAMGTCPQMTRIVHHIAAGLCQCPQGDTLSALLVAFLFYLLLAALARSQVSAALRLRDTLGVHSSVRAEASGFTHLCPHDLFFKN